MGCCDACPYILGKRYIDPKGRPLDDVRAIRDDIHAGAQQLVTGLDIAVA